MSSHPSCNMSQQLNCNMWDMHAEGFRHYSGQCSALYYLHQVTYILSTPRNATQAHSVGMHCRGSCPQSRQYSVSQNLQRLAQTLSSRAICPSSYWDLCIQGGPHPRAGSAALHGAALAGACKPAQPDVPFCQVCHCGVWAGTSQPQGEQVHQHPHGLAAQKQGQGAERRSQRVSAYSAPGLAWDHRPGM